MRFNWQIDFNSWVLQLSSFCTSDVCCLQFREWLFAGKLSEISLPSTTSAADMSLVAGRTIAHNIKIIVTFLGVASAKAYELASSKIAVLVEDWKFTKKLEIANETQEQQPKMSVPEIEVVTESGSEVCQMYKI